MDKNILKQLKTDYEDREIKPSKDLWDQIENGLDENLKTYKKPLFQWWKYAAVIVLFISVGSLFYFNSEKKSKSKEIFATDLPSDNTSKPIKTPIESIVSIENTTKNVPSDFKEATKQYVEFKNKPTEKNVPEQYSIRENAKEIDEVSRDLIEKSEKTEQTAIKPLIAETKKNSYISADDLLLGRELDRTRKESSDSRQFGVLDASKLKITRPHSLRIFGIKVFTDSTSAE